MPDYPTNEYTGSKNLVELTLKLRETIGQVSTLTTEAKTNVVAAINELVSKINQVSTDLANKTEIDDTQALGTNVWSALKTSQEIASAADNVKNQLLNGAGEAYDTLKELADLIQDNQSAIEALETIAGNHVRYDQAQSLTDEQKAQARSNIGAGSATELAEVKDKADSTEAALNAFKEQVGQTNIDLVSVFENGVTQ